MRLPNHVPVLTICFKDRAAQQELPAKLQRMLEADSIRVCLIEETKSFNSDVELVRGLVKDLLAADLILVDGSQVKSSACLFFSDDKDLDRTDSEENCFICSGTSDLQQCAAAIKAWLEKCRQNMPITGAVLIGGQSSRMGRPKHLIEADDGHSWLERSIATLNPFVSELVISGKGEIPDSLQGLSRVADLPDLQGPLAGIGALFQHHPFTSWLILACDMPYITQSSVQWLLDQRKPGFVAVIPKNPATARSEPLFGWYDFRCGVLINDLISSGSRRIRELCLSELILQPLIPDNLVDCWRNINCPEEV